MPAVRQSDDAQEVSGLTGTKVFFVLLVLIVVAFVAIEIVGIGNNKVTQPATAGTANSTSSTPQVSCNDHPALCAMSSMLDPFSPKLQLAQQTFTLTTAAPQMKIAVPPDSKNNFRKATFKFEQGNNCATVHYTSSDEASSNLHDQTWPSDKSSTRPGSLVILQSGGVLQFQLVGSASPCELVLQ
jgi:hypothetical protein